jgi:soluble lytic murein transglycosylase-like protein
MNPRVMTWRHIVVVSALCFTFPVSVNMGTALAKSEEVETSVPLSAARVICKWASRYGVDEDLAVRIAVAESGLDCRAKSSESSAGGLFQFVDSTFLDTQRQLAKPADISKKFDCEENAQLGAYLLSKGKYQHWSASRPAWDRDGLMNRTSESSASGGD